MIVIFRRLIFFKGLMEYEMSMRSVHWCSKFAIDTVLKTIGLLITLVVIVACAQDNNDTEQIESEVNQVFAELVIAARSLDVESYLFFFDQQKFTSLNEDGSVFHSLSEFEDSFREQIPLLDQYKSLEFSNVKITVINSTTAILVNEYVAEVILKSGESVVAAGAGTQVWSKSSGVWKLVNVSSSSKANN